MIPSRKLCLVILLSVILCNVAEAQLSAPSSMTSAFGNFSQFVSLSALKNVGNSGSNTVINSFNNMENIQGKRFLFDNWVKGTVTTSQGTTINSDSFAYNFDKTNYNLLATQNKADILTILPTDLQFFTLADHGKTYIFEHVKIIDPTKVYLTLSKSTNKYSLYKLLGTSFVKADFRNDGISQSGNTYDEYKDDSKYYIVMPGDSAYKQISLKQKAIMAALDTDKDKVSIYFKQHKGEDVNDNFLTGLISYLNQ